MIFLLEDDANIRSFVLYALTNSGLEAKGFERPSEFWEAMNSELPELVLLDIMLPEEDGLSVLAKLRKAPKTAALPVIMLTAKGSEYDKVIGLDSGADDYIVKPFGTMEMISRIKALLRRTSSTADKEFKSARLCVNPAKHIVKVDGNEIQLTFKEFELLCYLIENAGNVLSREKILAKVWDYGFAGESRTVDVHIRTLRQKLGVCGEMIETVRGVGYKFSDYSMG